MPAPLAITPSTRPDGTTVLTAVGEIDMSNADSLATTLDRTAGQLVVDLTAVDYLDSAGLAVLFDHADRIELVVAPLLMPVVTISGLAELTTVRSSGLPAS